MTVFKIIIQSDFSLKFKNVRKINNRCIIFGNGPSLNNILENNLSEIQSGDYDLLAVNLFCTSPYYELVRPNLYVLNAPEFWIPDVNNNLKRFRQKFIVDFINKTSWKIYLFLPNGARKRDWFTREIEKNRLINIIYYNTTPVEGFKKLNFFWFNLKLGMPRPHNVLIPSIMMAIYLRYNEIFLLGADHSWLKEIQVTDENLVLLSQQHFYDDHKVKGKPMHKLGKGSRKLYEVLLKFVYAFKAYLEINEYVKRKDIKIYNATKNSYIDAFDRNYIFD